MTDATPYPLPRETRQTDVLAGNGTAGPYGPFVFRIFDLEDVEVLLRAADESRFTEVPVTVTKVSGAAFDYFTILFSEAVPASSRFVVRSVRVPVRDAGVKSGTRLVPDALEKEFSKIAATEQELRRDIWPIDPDVMDGDVLVAQGGRIVSGPTAADVAAAEGHASTAASAATAAAASSTEAAMYAAYLGAAVYDFNFDSDPEQPGYDWNV